MKSTLLLFVFCLLIGPSGIAQLRVYHVSGEAYTQEKSGLRRLRFQDVVTPRPLVLKSGCQLVLFNEQGQTVSYSQAGTIPYAAVQKAFTTAPSSLSQAYLTYVFRKMRQQPEPTGRQDNRPVGGISRGEQPQLWAPADSIVLDQAEVTFQWVSEVDGPFLLKITDAAGSPLLEIKTPSSSLGLNLLRSPLQHNAVYYWSVTPITASASNTIQRSLVWPDEVLQNQFRSLLPKDGNPLSPIERQWQAQYRAKWFYERAKP